MLIYSFKTYIEINLGNNLSLESSQIGLTIIGQGVKLPPAR